MKWTGPAQWMKREAKAGDRLPFDRHIDDATIRLRDGAVMRTLHIGGMEFETAGLRRARPCPGGARSAAAQRRRRTLRALSSRHSPSGDSRLRRRVRFPLLRRCRQAVGCAAGERRLFVNDQFVTLVRRPARGKTGWPERLQRRFSRRTEDDHGAIRDLEAATASLLAGLEPYGARLLATYRTDTGELLGAARIPLEHLQRRDAPGRHACQTAATSAITFRTSASASASMRWKSRRERTQLRGHAVDQGLSGGDPARPDRRPPAAAVRAGPDRELRSGRPADRARADRPCAPPSESERGRQRNRAPRDALGARRARRWRRLASATITSAFSFVRRTSPSSIRRWRTPQPASPTSARSRCART